MRRFVVIALLCCLVTGQRKKKAQVESEVDGVVYEDEAEFASALGKFGVSLTNMDADQAVGGKTPREMRVRAKDIKKSAPNGAANYLIQFGYMEVALEKTEDELYSADTLIGEDDMSKALEDFQRSFGLEVTGEPDQPTLNIMKKRRCGAKDKEYTGRNRAKRYSLSRKRWPTHTLNYWFDPTKYTEDLPKEKVRSEFERALAMWAKVADVSFVEVETEAEAQIKISWDYGEHGDGYPFYGPGGTLAHAFYPVRGMLHFDDAEDFTADTIHGTNLHYVATHEMGHILGLRHSDNSLTDAIMYALYTGYTDNLRLHQDDIDGAVAAMGAGQGTVSPIGSDTGPVTVPPTDTPTDPPACIQKIDAAFHWDHDPEYMYLFAGAWYYRMVPKNPDGGNFLPVLDETSAPKRIGIDGFVGLPRNMDAAVETLEDPNEIYVFKDDQWVKYNIISGVVGSGTLADLWPNNTPTKIESAFRINNNNLGFIAGDRLYKYGRSSSSWSIGAAGSNYFAKYDDLNTISRAFYRSWVWAFRGNYYSVARSKNGVESSNYILRSITPDMKLPMCTEGVDQLSGSELKKCKKDYKKFKNRGGDGSYKVRSECKDYVAKKYQEEVEFDPRHFD